MGLFMRYTQQFYFFAQNQFSGGILSSQIEENLRKKAGRIYRSTRLFQASVIYLSHDVGSLGCAFKFFQG